MVYLPETFHIHEKPWKFAQLLSLSDPVRLWHVCFALSRHEGFLQEVAFTPQKMTHLGLLAGLAWSLGCWRSLLCAVLQESWAHKGSSPPAAVHGGRQALGGTVELSSITEAGGQSGFPLSHKIWLVMSKAGKQVTLSSVETRGGNTGKSLQDASEIGAFLGASAWHSMVISLGLPEALPPKCLKIAFCRLLESTVGSPKQLGCRHFGLEHKIR